MGQNNRGLPAILRFRAVILSQLHRTASAIWFRHPSTRGQLSATLYKLAQQKWSVIKSALGQNHCGHFKWVSMKTGSPFFDIDFNLCHSYCVGFSNKDDLHWHGLPLDPPLWEHTQTGAPFLLPVLWPELPVRIHEPCFPHCIQLSLFKHCYSIVMHSFYSLWHLHYKHNSFVFTVGIHNPEFWCSVRS